MPMADMNALGVNQAVVPRTKRTASSTRPGRVAGMAGRYPRPDAPGERIPRPGRRSERLAPAMPGRDRQRGAHQVVLAVRATARRDAVDALRDGLEAMGAGAPPQIPFAELGGVHFARFVLLEDSTDLDGRLIPASVLYMVELDAPLERHVRELADRGAAGLDAVFGLCDGYPAGAGAAARAAFLRD